GLAFRGLASGLFFCLAPGSLFGFAAALLLGFAPGLFFRRLAPGLFRRSLLPSLLLGDALGLLFRGLLGPELRLLGVDRVALGQRLPLVGQASRNASGAPIPRTAARL